MSFDRELQTLAGPALSMDFFLVPWDTQVFGFPVAQINAFKLKNGGDSAGIYRRFEDWRDGQNIRIVSCKLDHFALRESMFLEARGFRFVEMVYRPSLSLKHANFPDSELRIEHARPADLPEIEAIAGSAFDTGRYLLDWRLDSQHSHLRYRNWLRNSAVSADQEVLTASANGEIVGFFIIEKRPDDSVYWHLTAIAAHQRGRGLGKQLWRAMALRAWREGATRVETTISAHNLPVINLYAQLGFRFDSAQMTLHWLQEMQS